MHEQLYTMEVVNDLAIAPFSEIFEKATTAHQNGDGNQEMLAESQKLVKGAERVLKMIVPLCTRLYDNHGYHFIDELKQHGEKYLSFEDRLKYLFLAGSALTADADEIAEYRLKLNDHLWDFEDMLDADAFDKDAYVSLQKLCKTAGLAINNILLRMKLEPLPKEQLDGCASPASPATPMPTPPMPSHLHGRSIPVI